MNNISKSYSSPVITRVVPHTQGYYWKRTHNISQITLHHCMGTFAGSLRWLTTVPRPTNPTSAHFMVNLDEVVLMNGPSERACWSDGADSNLYTVSIEMANTIDAAPWPIAEKTLRKTAELCADLARFYKLGKLKLGGNVQLHKHMSSTECPGPTGTARAQDIVNWANEINGYGSAPSTPSVPNHSHSNSGKYTTGTVVITADVLNVRAGASTNDRIVTSVKKNEIFTITEVKGSWGKLLSGAGWIHLGYTSPVGTKENNGQFKVSVVPQVLHVRSEPNVNSKINTKVSTGEVYTIIEQKGEWGKLLSGAGWIHLGYTKRL